MHEIMIWRKTRILNRYKHVRYAINTDDSQRELKTEI